MLLTSRRARQRRRRKPRRVSFSTCAVMALVVVIGVALNLFLALRPAVLESRARDHLRAAFGLAAEFESLRITWARGVELEGLRLTHPAPSTSSSDVSSTSVARREPPLLSVERVRLVPKYLSLLKGAFEVDAFVLEQPRLALERRGDGTWNFASILDAIEAQSDADADSSAAQPEAASPILSSFRLAGGRIRLVDRVVRPQREVVLEDVFASLRRQEGGALRFQGECRAPHMRRARVVGDVSDTGQVRAAVSVEKLDLGAPLHSYVENPDVAQTIKRIRVSGVADLHADLSFDSLEGFQIQRLSASISRCDVDHERLPFPLKGIEGRLSMRNQVVAIDSLSGQVGGGPLSLSGSAEFSRQWELQRWTMRARAASFPVNHRLRDVLTGHAREIYDEYSPTGRIGIELDVAESLVFPPRPRDVLATLTLDGVDVSYRHFPYLVRGARGQIVVKDGRLEFPGPIEATEGPVRVAVSGYGADLRAGGKVGIVVRIAGVPLDERFRGSLPLQSRQIWDDFRATGTADGVVNVYRAQYDPTLPEDELRELRRIRVAVNIFPRQLHIAYRHFPYQVENIGGEIRLDFPDNLMTIVGLKGQHGDQTITGQGAVDFGEEGLFHVSLHADSLRVDEEFAEAIPESGRNLLRDFDFRGEVGLDVKIQSTESLGLVVNSLASLHRGSVRHKDFPYRIPLEGGSLELLGEETLKFSGVRTPDDFRPRVEFHGELIQEGTQRTLGFGLDIAELQFDGRLVAALPPQLRRFVEKIGLGGTYGGKLTGTFEFDEVDPSHVAISYRGDDIVLEGGEVDFGLRIKEIDAKSSFSGTKFPGKPHSLMGEVRASSAWFNRLHLTGTVVEFCLGMVHPHIRAVRDGDEAAKERYDPPRSFVRRLTRSSVDETFQAFLASREMYGGRFDGFLYVDAGEQKDLAGHFTADGLKVAMAAEDVFGAPGTGTEGEASGEVEFAGRVGDSRSVVGQGRGSIKRAKLVQLPLFVGILGVLFGDSLGDHYFNSVDLEYLIKDGKFVATPNGIRIESRGIKLRGDGTMDFDGKLNLTLLPRLFNVEVPVFESVLSAIKSVTGRIVVKGDLANPSPKFVTVGIGFEIGSENEPPPPLPSDLRREAKKSSGERPDRNDG